MNYDYWISYPSTPAFEDAIKLMLSRIDDAGSSPTIVNRGGGDVSASPAAGTRNASGKQLLHFMLPDRLDETEIEDWLTEGMGNPKPPITIEAIISFDGADILKAPSKSKFLPFWPDIVTGVEQDAGGRPITRSPNMTDELVLSKFAGAASIVL